MAPQKPANWEEVEAGKYKAVLRLNRTQGSGQTKQNIRVINNITNGNYDVYETNFGASDRLIYSYNASDDKIVINNQGVYEQIFTGQNSQQKLNFEKSIKESTIKLAEWNAAAFQTQQKTSELNELKNKPGYKSLANAAASSEPVGGSPDPTTGTGASPQQDPTKNKFDLFDDGNRASVPDAEGQRNNYNNPKGGAWIYPTALRTNGQDYIKFEIIKYEPRQFKLNAKTGAILDKRSPQKTPMGTICLPIQPSVTDNNTVDWNGIGVNPLELGVADFSMSIMNGNGGQQFDNIMEYLSGQINDSGVQSAIKLALAQRAASTSGLLSRVTGAVVNPNLELLFQGPQLRPFNFSFRLSPRNTDEARIVKGIIRAFKEAMAVKVASSELFLKAPNVFNIKYIRGRSTDRNGRVIDEIDPHPSINKIKTCALQACNVDYTPDGTYMTFADSSATMTSYNISLQFQELEPVTSKDYDTNYESIGY